MTNNTELNLSQNGTTPLIDQEWLEKQPPELQPLIKRVGKELFSFCMRQGGAKFAAEELATNLRRFPQAMTSLSILINYTNELTIAYIQSKGWTPEQVNAVHEDIGRIALLMNADGNSPKTKGGIIIPH